MQREHNNNAYASPMHPNGKKPQGGGKPCSYKIQHRGYILAAPHTMQAGKLKYYKELDGVRGFAALMIFCFHFFHGYTPPNAFAAVWLKCISFGPTMANLFFVLSGFLITQILLAAKGTENYFSYYYARRILRIFPLYYIGLLIYFFALPLLYGRPIPALSLQWYNWVHLQNLPLTFKWPHAGPKYLWSLAVEEHFYLFWPVLVLLLKPRQLIATCIAICIGAVACRCVLTAYHYPVFYFTFSTMDALAAGAIAGVLQYNGRLVKYRKAIKYGALITGIPAIWLWLVYFGERNDLFFIAIPILMNLFYTIALSYLVTSPTQNLIRKTFSTKALTFTGTISYGFFIFHPLCISFITKALQNSSIISQVSIALISSLLVATFSYYWLEKKFMVMKKYFRG